MATLTYQHTEVLTDAQTGHIEMARQKVQAAVLVQAYPQVKTAATWSAVVTEQVVLPVGKQAGSITRTLTITS